MSETVNLKQRAKAYKENTKDVRKRIVVCAGTGCIAGGALKIIARFEELIKEKGLDVALVIDKHEDGYHLTGSGCQGFCQMGPLVTIQPDQIMYCKVTPDDVEEIILKSVLQDNVVDRLVYKRKPDNKAYPRKNKVPFFENQRHMVLQKVGVIDPTDINEYISLGGYAQAEKATKMKPAEICSFMMDSGLRGAAAAQGSRPERSGIWRASTKATRNTSSATATKATPARLWTARRWRATPTPSSKAMMIAAMAIGADEGYVYVRAEYPLAVKRIRAAVKAAEDAGILGEHMLGTDKAFTVTVMEGAGAFVCGEETALMASIEGKRGMPAPKPPLPCAKGAVRQADRHQQRGDALHHTAHL